MKGNELSNFGLKLSQAGLFDAFMSMFKLVAAVMVLGQDKLDISSIASDVNLIAAHFFNNSCKRPHADTPRVTGIWASNNLCVPLPLLLASDLPEITFSPLKRLLRCAIN